MLAVLNPRGWHEVLADVGPDAPGQRKDHASDRCCFFLWGGLARARWSGGKGAACAALTPDPPGPLPRGLGDGHRRDEETCGVMCDMYSRFYRAMSRLIGSLGFDNTGLYAGQGGAARIA